MKNNVLITVSGGVVTAVYASDPDTVITVVDYDNYEANGVYESDEELQQAIQHEEKKMESLHEIY